MGTNTRDKFGPEDSELAKVSPVQGEVHHHQAGKAAEGGPRIERAVVREVAPERILHDGLVKVWRHSCDYERVCAPWRR